MNMLLGEIKMVVKGCGRKKLWDGSHIYTITGAEKTKLIWVCMYIYIYIYV
jgi:hypothetical protein